MNQILNTLSSVGFNWHVALANFVNFLIILFLLNIFFFKKIGGAIDKRHALIERGLTQAKEAEVLLSAAEEKECELLHAANKKRDELLMDAKAKGDMIVQSLQEEADAEIRRRKDALSLDESTVLSRTEEEFAKKAPALIASLYAKTLLREMTPDENNALIARIQAK
jgi:F0F1-type ATP synthase membrane subunit b/b'